MNKSNIKMVITMKQQQKKTRNYLQHLRHSARYKLDCTMCCLVLGVMVGVDTSKRVKAVHRLLLLRQFVARRCPAVLMLLLGCPLAEAAAVVMLLSPLQDNTRPLVLPRPRRRGHLPMPQASCVMPIVCLCCRHTWKPTCTGRARSC